MLFFFFHLLFFLEMLFFSPSTQSCVTSLGSFSILLSCSFYLSSRPSPFVFFFFFSYPLFSCFFSKRISHIFPCFLSSFFNCSFSSSPKFLHRNFFLFLRISLNLQFMNLDFLFTGDITLFQLVFPFS